MSFFNVYAIPVGEVPPNLRARPLAKHVTLTELNAGISISFSELQQLKDRKQSLLRMLASVEGEIGLRESELKP